MIVKGYTEDGCQIMQTHGGVVIESAAKRDARLEEVRMEKIRDAAPDLLAVCQEFISKLGPDGYYPTAGAPATARMRAAIAKATTPN